MNKKQLSERIDRAITNVRKEQRDFASGGKFAAGISNEGYTGGFLQCLYDIQQLLHDVEPNDDRGYWK